MRKDKSKMSLVNNTIQLYEPQFDIETSKWKDEAPYKPYSRNKVMYRCPCNYKFCSNIKQSWDAHFKTQTHRLWLEHYGGDKIVLKEKDKEIKQLRIRIGEMEKTKIDMAKKNLELQKVISEVIGYILPVIRSHGENAKKEHLASNKNLEKLNEIYSRL